MQPEGRVSGVLLHPTCLPGRFGIGDLGGEAYRFVDFLAQAGQRLWQVLPLGPTGYGNSPYMCFSAFAGNGLLVDLEELAARDLLMAAELTEVPSFPGDRVDYPAVIAWKTRLLQRAHERFERAHRGGYPDDWYAFCERNAFWLEDYALFRALKEHFDDRVWTAWDGDAAGRDPDALLAWRERLEAQVRLHRFIQYTFFRQWHALKEHCNRRGIAVVGDVPIYVAHDSAEVWATPEVFHLDDAGHPKVIAGVPPDYFSATGQRWGNPIYRWEAMRERGYSWWIERFRLNFELADMVRLDHFRGFEAYWEIPATEETAVNGRWVKGPGLKFFQAVRDALGDLPMIAEDLGVITPEVDALREATGLPGMRILQVAFGTDSKASEYRPHSHVANCVVYTATHDHNTTVGWFTTKPGRQTTQTAEEVAAERRETRLYTGSDGAEIHWDFIRLALGSVARMAIFPMQDLLGLGSESRMNLPGTGTGNWEWRVGPAALTPALAARLRELTRVFGRVPERGGPDAGQ